VVHLMKACEQKMHETKARLDSELTQS